MKWRNEGESLWLIRRTLKKILDSQTRLEALMSAATEYITSALTNLDTQMSELQARLGADATALQEALAAAIASAGLAADDEAALTSAADRITATATVVSGLALPSVVADPETSDSAGPLPA